MHRIGAVLQDFVLEFLKDYLLPLSLYFVSLQVRFSFVHARGAGMYLFVDCLACSLIVYISPKASSASNVDPLTSCLISFHRDCNLAQLKRERQLFMHKYLYMAINVLTSTKHNQMQGSITIQFYYLLVHASNYLSILSWHLSSPSPVQVPVQCPFGFRSACVSNSSSYAPIDTRLLTRSN